MNDLNQKSPLVLTDMPSYRQWIAGLPLGITTGFVPTMGALHAGHRSLVERARQENDRVVTSIFVNPTQFDRADDLKHYPRTLEADLELLHAAGCDAVLIPSYEALYPDQFRYSVDESALSRELCGAHRPGHFKGMLTVVLKLLCGIAPTRAYFGEKDLQQLELVRGMTEAFFLDTEIVACPTVREGDGLALSSRNVRLTPEERVKAPEFVRTLRESRSAEQARSRLEELGFRVDYVEDRKLAGARHRMGAVYLGEVRLIDHVQI